MALPTVLLALVVIGALMAGAFFSSTREYQAGRSAIDQRRALLAAEDGLALMIGAWDTLVGDAGWAAHRIERVSSRQEQAALSIRTAVQPLSPLAYWVTAESIVGEGLSTESVRRVGAVVRFDPPPLHLPAALSVNSLADADDGGADLHLDGSDNAPVGWTDCTGLSGSVADLATGSAGDAPGIADERLADTAAVAAELDEVWRTLLAKPGISLSGGTVVGTPESPLGPREVNGVCDRSNPLNWGDPDRSTSCARYFPVILATGDLHVAGGVGQGVLLVEGDLTLSGGTRFVGLVIVRGSLRTLSPGPHVIGGVRVAGETGASTTLSGGGRFEYSRCALMQSLAAHLGPRLEPGSWIELHR